MSQPFEKTVCEGVSFTRGPMERRMMVTTRDEDGEGYHTFDEDYGKLIVEQLKPDWFRFDSDFKISDIKPEWLKNRNKMEFYISNDRLNKYLPVFENVSKLIIETRHRVNAIDLIKSMRSISILKVTGNKNTYCTEEIVDEIAKRADNLETVHFELSKDSSVASCSFFKLTSLPCVNGKRYYATSGRNVFIVLVDQPNNELWNSYDFDNMPGFERCRLPRH